MNGKQIISLVLGTTLSGCSAPLKSLSLQERLEAIASRDAPKCEPRVAMCYVIAAPPDQKAYICPVCGNKTVYMTQRTYSRGHKNRLMEGSWEEAVFNVESMRRKMEELHLIAQRNGYALTLDESSLCARCGKDKKTDFILVAKNARGDIKRTAGVTDRDLIYLTAFFYGEDYYPPRVITPGVFSAGMSSRKGDGKDGFPLKEKTGRIAELLGLAPPSSSPSPEE